MEDDTIMKIWESYLNGNISYVKSKVRRMSKAEFITFLEYARASGYHPYRLRGLVN